MLQRILLLAILLMVCAGCHSEERKAYDYAKEEGKSDFYAKAYAEQIAEGKGKIYAEAYAFALEMIFNNDGKDGEILFRDDKTKNLFAKIYAQESYAGRTVSDAARFAKLYCDILPVAIANGKDEKYTHEFTGYYLSIEKETLNYSPDIDAIYLQNLSTKFAMERIDGKTKEEAYKKAQGYAFGKFLEHHIKRVQGQ